MDKFPDVIAPRISGWPDEAITELLQVIGEIESKYSISYGLSDDERAAVREGLAQADRGELVSDEAVATYFDRYRS